MSKEIGRYYVLCCIACHATHTTLYKMSKEVRMCKPCIKKLAQAKELKTASGGLLQFNKQTQVVTYAMPVEEEEVTNGN